MQIAVKTRLYTTYNQRKKHCIILAEYENHKLSLIVCAKRPSTKNGQKRFKFIGDIVEYLIKCAKETRLKFANNFRPRKTF